MSQLPRFSYPPQTTQDYRTLEQILIDLINKDDEIIQRINQIENDHKILNQKLMILYKDLKKYGISTELLD